MTDNQPVIRDSICAIHNGIVNEGGLESIILREKYTIDSEVIVAIAQEHLQKNNSKVPEIPNKVLSLCKGVVACALFLPEHGKLLLFFK